MLLRREEKMNLFDLANLLDNDGNLQNEMMVMAFAATLLSTIPGMYILLIHSRMPDADAHLI